MIYSCTCIFIFIFLYFKPINAGVHMYICTCCHNVSMVKTKSETLLSLKLHYIVFYDLMRSMLFMRVIMFLPLNSYFGTQSLEFFMLQIFSLLSHLLNWGGQKHVFIYSTCWWVREKKRCVLMWHWTCPQARQGDNRVKYQCATDVFFLPFLCYNISAS